MHFRLSLDNGLIPRFGTGSCSGRGARKQIRGKEVQAMTSRIYMLLALLALIALAATLGGEPWGP